MEKERIQPARNSRTIQQRSAGSENIMDNRPDGCRNYLSAAPLQRASLEEEEEPIQGKLSNPIQRVEEEKDDDETEPSAVQRKTHRSDVIQCFPIPQAQMDVLNRCLRHDCLQKFINLIVDTRIPAEGTPTGTTLKYQGKFVFHETFAAQSTTVFFTYDVNGDALILGIGFHKKGNNYGLRTYCFGRTQKSINLDVDKVWED